MSNFYWFYETLKEILVEFQNYANDHSHERNWANTWICVVFKMFVDESYRYTRGYEAIGDLTGV